METPWNQHGNAVEMLAAGLKPWKGRPPSSRCLLPSLHQGVQVWAKGVSPSLPAGPQLPLVQAPGVGCPSLHPTPPTSVLSVTDLVCGFW